MVKAIFLQFLILRLDRQIRAIQLNSDAGFFEINNGIHRPRPSICDGFCLSIAKHDAFFIINLSDLQHVFGVSRLLQSYLGVVWRKMFLEYERSASQPDHAQNCAQHTV
jgi:hypothetical protein